MDDKTRTSARPRATTLIVQGRVHDATGRPRAGLTVAAYNQHLRKRQTLGQAKTDRTGHFTIPYARREFARAKQGRVHLLVVVKNAAKKELVRSSVLFNFNEEAIATVDLVVPTRPVSNWERVVAGATPLLKGQGVNADSLTESDFRFIAAETGIDADDIRLWSLAAKTSAEAKSSARQPIDASVFYAWFRQGLPRSLSGLLSQGPQQLRAALEASVRSSVIPMLSDTALDGVMSRIQALGVHRVLVPATPSDQTSFGDLLHLGVSSDARSTIAQAYVDHGPMLTGQLDGQATLQDVEQSAKTQAFWDALHDNKNVPAEDLTQIKWLVSLQELTGGHLPLIKALQQMGQDNEPLATPRALANLDAQGWTAILLSPQDRSDHLSAPVGMPPGHDNIEAYARTIVETVQGMFPMAVLANHIEQADDGPFASTKKDLTVFFTNNPAFSFADQTIDTYLSTGAPAKLKGVRQPAALRIQLTRMGRLYKFAPLPDQMQALLEDKIYSAQAVVLLGDAEFTRRYRGVFAGDADIAKAFRTAQDTSIQTLVLFQKLGSLANRPLPLALSTSGGVVDTSSFSAADRATWNTMFGSVDLCQCDECQSLAGPAAYLFDTLEFVKGMTATGTSSAPLDELLSRRPDLAHVELTCDNTNVKLPYVDLVNEVLENAVAPRRKHVSGTFSVTDFDAGTLPSALKQALGLTSKATLVVDTTQPAKSWAIRDPGWRYIFGTPENGLDVRPYPQSSLNESELGANPEHVNVPAYATLARTRYPWNLPFNLPVEAARVYLTQLGVERYDLMEALADPSVVLSQMTIVHERLGVTQAEADMMTGATLSATGTADEPWTFWGFDSATAGPLPDPNDPDNPAANLRGAWNTILQRVPIFLAQSGLEYRDLLDLLRTFTLNPVSGGGRTLTLTSIDALDQATCNLNKLQISGLTPAILKKIHRFVRLQRALGWTPYDLDRAVTTFGATDFTESFLQQLAHVQRLKTTLGLPTAGVLAFYANIDSRTYLASDADEDRAGLESLYAHLFRNKAVISPPDAAFTEDQTQLQGTLSGHSGTIIGALRISASDFAVLTTGSTAVVPSDVLSLTNLSALYRHATLAGGLKLSIADFLQAKRLVGVNPFTDTVTTVRFAQQMAAIGDAGFTVAEVAYLLRHESADPSFLPEADEQTAILLGQLRDGLRKIADDQTVVSDPQGAGVSKKLAQLNWNAAYINQLTTLIDDDLTTSAALTLLPAGIVFPDAIASRVSYDAAQLHFKGVMSGPEQTTLQNADPQVGPSAFKTAVGALYTNSRAAARTFFEQRVRAFELPPFHAPTAPPLLTQAVTFPDSLKTRIQYNATDHTVEAVGAFSDTERAQLVALSADGTYRLAIQSLDNQAKSYVPGLSNEFLISSADPLTNRTLTSFTALFDSGKSVEERFGYLLVRICAYLRTRDSEVFVKQKLTDSLKIAPEVVDVLVSTALKSASDPTHTKAIADLIDATFGTSQGDITSQVYPNQFAMLTRIQKVALCIRRLSLTPVQVTTLANLSAVAQWVDWNDIPVTSASLVIAFSAWERLNEALDLRGAPFDQDDAPFDLIALANVTTTTKAAFLQAVCDATRWDLATVQALAGAVAADPGALNLTFPDAFKNGGGLTRLRGCISLITRLGISVTQLTEWSLANLANDIASDTEWTRALANADAVKNAVKAKYDDDQWLTLAKPLRDRLRERQRASLVAYLVAQNVAGVDESDLYEYFLIDVEMGSCMMTTRLMQAICSVQLFVQRCLMNLEPGAALTPAQAKEWHAYRRLQRVFEANREVFLYPENWIEPELRGDKSPFFKALESELQQGDITTDTAEDAVLHYLEKLDQVARLEIVGMCLQHDAADTAGADDVLHVFGRTYATPHLYFYRHFDGQVDAGQWSAWEKVDLDVTGDHLIPLLWNRHLYIFWPIFTEKATTSTKDQRANNEDPEKYWEIKLAWSEYKHGRWLPKKITGQALNVRKDPSPDVPQDPEDFTFTVRIRERDPNSFWDFGFTGPQLIINCYGTTITPAAPPVTVVAEVPRVLIQTIPAWMPGVDDYSGVFNTTGIGAVVNKTDQTIKIFNMEHAGASGSGLAIDAGHYQDVNMTVPWADGQPDFSNSLRYLEVTDGSGSVLYRVWQSNRSDGDYVRYSADGLWHDSGTHAGNIRGNHALVVSPASVALDGLREPIQYTFQFRTEGQGLRPSEASSVVLEARWQANTGSQQYPLDTNASVLLPADTRFAQDMYLVSDRFTVDPDIAISVSDHWVNAVVTERTVVVSLVALPAAETKAPPVTGTPDYKPWQAIGCFVSNDCHSDLNAIPAAGALPSMQPTSLEPLGRTQFVDMMMVEHGTGSDSFGKNTVVLARTPGTFHVLTRPEGYLPAHVSYPFAYQDDQRTYLGTATKLVSGGATTYKARFSMLFHPRICAFLAELDTDGLSGLLDRDTQSVTDLGTFTSAYAPSTSVVDLDIAGDATRRTPREDVDFSYTGAYSLYNWELFFHIPFLIATKLTKNQRFEEARDWFHYIFDPTSADTGGRERFWQFQPFHDEAGHKPQTLSEFVTAQSQALQTQVDAWKAHPFEPHVIARLRLMAYMKSVVMKYIDNLIEWGDQLFRRDTLEWVNEATQLYVLALRILGKRPTAIPPRATPVVQTFNSLDSLVTSGMPAVNAFGEALVDIETYLAPSTAISGASTGGASLGTMPLFCIPQNDMLLGYWDKVADRLSKIRHCLNIEGVRRELPTFAPKIDPALLVQAAAAGVDLDSVLSDLYAPLPTYRFNIIQQKASELCGDVRAFGGAMLAALEKRDAEALARLRSGQELDLLTAVRQVKDQQVQEATNTLDALNKYQDVVTARQTYYSSRPFLNDFEAGHLVLTGASLLTMLGHVGAETVAGVLHLIPDAKAGGPTTVGVTYGGSNVASAVQAFGGAISAAAGIMSAGASLSATLGGHQRRAEDWAHQADLATKELEQVKKQIAAANIRLAIANVELENHDLQSDHAKKVDEFMREKYTNEELYDWMVGQISGVYFQSYKLAYDAAKRAERCYRFELGLDDSRFIQFGYWDSLKRGLLAGEQLQLDLRRLEMDYLDRNKREFEIAKSVSLQLHDPVSLVRLKETGACEVELPETLFDMDYPGHYLRRLKNVSLTIPCVAGPYTSVNCTLTLLSSKMRVQSLPAAPYPEAAGDTRFVSSVGALQSIATSHAQNDSGMFELNFRDERYLPFEGMGAISRWRIDMPRESNAFDFDTIADIVIHARYTARGGGDTLATAAAGSLMGLLTDVQNTPLVRSFSLRHEFPTEWSRFLNSTTLCATSDTTHQGIDQRLRLNLANRFPFQHRAQSMAIISTQLFLKLKDDVAGRYDDLQPLVIDLAHVSTGNTTALATAASLMKGGSPLSGLPFVTAFRARTEDAGVWELRVTETRRDGLAQDVHTGTGNLPQALRETVVLNGVNHQRLKADAVKDILMVCVYSLTV